MSKKGELLLKSGVCQPDRRPVFGKRSLHTDFLVAHGVVETYAARHKAYASVGIRARSPVFEISLYAAAYA